MHEDFTNTNLRFSEKIRLSIMYYLRFFKKYFSEKFFGETIARNLLLIKFIESHYTFHDTTIATKPYVPKYSLSDRYFRYRVFRWNRFWDSKVWPFVISILTSVIASIITTVLILKLGLSATP